MKNPVRISLLVIAASLAIVTGALNLSAYLSTSTPPLNKDFVGKRQIKTSLEIPKDI